VKKTTRAITALRPHWRLPPFITIKTYEWLGTRNAKTYLTDTHPDVIVCDEGHRIRNLKAARTRVVKRYAEARHVSFVIVSGTLIDKRLNDFAHLSRWALKEGSPVPRKYNTIAHWGGAVDHDASIPPGVLGAWCDANESVREAYQRRVVSTPGVVATDQGLVGVALNGFAWRTPIPPVLVEALDTLRKTWTLPDGYTVTDPLEYYRKARQLTLGVYYRWREQPPEAWREARLDWGRVVRHACRYLQGPTGLPFDSEKDVALAIVNGHLDKDIVAAEFRLNTKQTYEHWRDWRPRFIPNIEHVWVTDDVIKQLIEFASVEPTLVWVEPQSGGVAVGLRMHALGLPYYGAKQCTPEGKHILDADPTRSMALSIEACGEGLDLQPWQRTLVSAPVPNANKWEQFLGRNHRSGQTADEIDVYVAQLAAHHEESWVKALHHAMFLREMTGQQQRLLQMTLVDLPEGKEETC
jgi:hypothetical protein